MSPCLLRNRDGVSGEACVLRDLIDIKGASERTYRFMLVREGRPLSPMGGNYLYVLEEDGALKVLWVGETQNMLKDARDMWGQAVQMHGAVGLYMRLNISERIRLQEHKDLLDGLKPPMNAAEARKSA
jgi:hypothetical protein